MLASLEMRIREAKEDLGKLGFMEEVGEELHGVGAHTGDVLVQGCSCVLCSEGANAILHELCHLRTDLESYNQGFGKPKARP